VNTRSLRATFEWNPKLLKLFRRSQCEGNEGGTEEAGPILGDSDQGFLVGAPTLVHLAASHFIGGCIDEAEFAYGQVILFIANGRPKGSALNWPERVEIAGSGVGIEDGAGFVVGEVFEGFFLLRLGEEQAGGWVSREVGKEARTRRRSARADAFGYGGVGRCQAFVELLGIELRDGEHADAALMAAGSTGEPITRASRG
jgi:hypothetical protein